MFGFFFHLEGKKWFWSLIFHVLRFHDTHEKQEAWLDAKLISRFICVGANLVAQDNKVFLIIIFVSMFICTKFQVCM